MTAWPPPPASYPTYPQPPRPGPPTSLLVLGAIGFFIAGAIASFAALVVIGLIVGDDTTSGGGDGPAEVRTYGPGGDLETFALAPSQCGPADLDDVAAIPEGTNVDCGTEHAIEAYATLQPPVPASNADAAFRHDDLSSFADEACYVAFFPYVASEYEDSDLDYLPVMPSQQAWEEQGARTITCVLFHDDGETLTGPARASSS